jgi:glutamate racemase
MTGDRRCIGVFDSGIGGLTVVRELRRRLPHEDIVYFGDTARVPYGAKSTQTVTRFSQEICQFLLTFDPKLIVVACNTASAVALGDLSPLLPVPVYGVVEPGARKAVECAEGGLIAVIATEATIGSDAYRRAIAQAHAATAARSNPRVLQKACPLFVPLVEEGRGCGDPITQSIVRDYLDPLLKIGPRVVVLGCTHYPLLREAIGAVAGPQVALVDSGEQTAQMVADKLASRGAMSPATAAGSLSCYVSDNPQRFKELGQRFLGHPITDVTWISHEKLFSADAPLPH